MRRLPVDPDHPAQDVLSEAARVLREGGLVAFPTETVYGLAADAGNAAAVERLYRLKGRNPNKAMALLVGDRESIEDHVQSMPRAAQRLIERFWPGPVTLVVPGRGGKTIGLRMPSLAVARKLPRAAGFAIAQTSANESGAPPALCASEVGGALGDAVVLVAKTTWLVCEEVCISGEATLELRLPISSKAPRSDGRWGDLFARTRRLLPREPEAGALSAVWSGDKVILRLKNDSDVPAVFFPSDEGVLDNAAPQSATRSDGLLAVALTLSTENEPPASLQLRGVLVVGDGDSRTAFAVNVPVTSGSESPSFILAAAVVVVVVAAVLILMLRRTRETPAGETG